MRPNTRRVVSWIGTRCSRIRGVSVLLIDLFSLCHVENVLGIHIQANIEIRLDFCGSGSSSRMTWEI